MPRPRQPLHRCYCFALLRRSVGAAFLGAAVTSGAAGCGARSNDADPTPVVSARSDAQVQFRELKEAWHAANPQQRLSLEQPLREFLFAYPHEDTRRLARAYLAWILIQKDQLAEAGHLVDELTRGPAGAARDLANLVQAALLLRHGYAQEALKVLRPLSGKLLDPTEQFLATEQFVLAAMQAKLYSEAIAGMADWIAGAGALQREAVRDSVRTQLRLVPRRYLERALATPPQPSEGARREGRQHEARWIYESLTRLLIDMAVAAQDADLAARILRLNPASVGVGSEAAELVRLATSHQASTAVVARSFGLVLSTASPVARRRSIEVATAIAATLDLAQTRGADRAQLLVTEPLEQIESALEDVLNQGAGLLIAGVTAHDANLAASFAERKQVPVLLLTPPMLKSAYAFSIGVSTEAEQQLLAANIPLAEAVRVIGPDDCAAAAAGSAFPVGQWRTEQVSALLFAADTVCARGVLADLRRERYKPHCLFGLESATLSETQLSFRRTWLRAHRFPLERGSDADADQLIALLGHPPSWFEALGRDTALLVSGVLQQAQSRAAASESVPNVHELLRQALLDVHRGDLWTTADARFDPEHQLTRRLAVEQRTGE